MWLGCGVMLLGGVYFLWTNGYQNIVGYAMLLLCPLMHLFMHRGHHHGAESHPASSKSAAEDPANTDRKPACH